MLVGGRGETEEHTVGGHHLRLAASQHGKSPPRKVLAEEYPRQRRHLLQKPEGRKELGQFRKWKEQVWLGLV